MKKIINKIIEGRSLENNEMRSLVGGTPSNKNSGDPCTCYGSTDGWLWCNDNSNKAKDCYCEGNENNTNKINNCTCGTTPPPAPVE